MAGIRAKNMIYDVAITAVCQRMTGRTMRVQASQHKNPSSQIM